MSTLDLLQFVITGFVLLGFAFIGVGWYKAKNREATEDRLHSELSDADGTASRLRGEVDDLQRAQVKADDRATAQDLVIAGLRAEVGVLQRSAEGATGPLRVMSDLMRDLMREMLAAVVELTKAVKEHRQVAESGLSALAGQAEEILEEVRTEEPGRA